MRTKVQKWGNSLALRIPKTFALDAQLKNNSVVEIALIDGAIIIKPIRPTRWSLQQLMADITDDNIHQEISTGDAMGKEIW
ncbi:MAG: AbrB/MazE/SpoVT family DNA-binding domain-containing protein [Clostridia bacterium]|nr:MAG: AbrB/MazE/SpoVT family DNA-binding domain-containing protein [Clostridia bacterium]